MSNASDNKDSIEQIRDLIVGPTQRDLERRVSRLDSHFSARLGELQVEARRRLEVIEMHLRKETEALSNRLDGELVETKEAIRSLTRTQHESTVAFEQRISKLEESLLRTQHELRAQILEQAKSFIDELQHTREEFSETVERELGSLEFEPAEESQSREQPHEASASPAP